MKKALTLTLAALSLVPSLRAQNGEPELPGLFYALGTTTKDSSNNDWSYLLWQPSKPGTFDDRHIAIYHKTGNADSAAPFVRRSITTRQGDARTVSAILPRAVTIGGDHTALEQSIDALFQGVIPDGNLTLSEKLSAVIRGTANDPERQDTLFFLARRHPAVALALGQGFTEKITSGTLHTYEVREYDIASESDVRVIARLTVDTSVNPLLTAPGAPVAVIPPEEDLAQGHLTARLRWETPQVLLLNGLKQNGFNLYRFPSTVAEGSNYHVTPPTPAQLRDEAKHCNEVPILVEHDLNAAEAIDPMDLETHHFADNDGTSNGDTFYYFVTAVDILGRDGLSSPGTFVTICDLLPPPPVKGVTVTNDLVYENGTTAQRFLISWPAASDPESGVDEYLVYRWTSIEEMQQHVRIGADGRPLDESNNPLNGFLVATVPHVGNQARYRFRDDSIAAPSIPPAQGQPNPNGALYFYTVRVKDNGSCGGNASANSGPASGVLRDNEGPEAPTGEVLITCYDPDVSWLPPNSNTTELGLSGNAFHLELSCETSPPAFWDYVEFFSGTTYLGRVQVGTDSDPGSDQPVANSVNYTGSLVGHTTQGNSNPEKIFNQAGVQINHPYNGLFVGYYTQLTGPDAYNFDNGSNLFLGSNPINSTVYNNAVAPNPSRFVGSFSPGHGLQAGGITATNNNTVHIAAKGFGLNLTVPADHFYEVATGIEHRFYRGGTIALFEEYPAGTFTNVYEVNNLAAEIVINWPEVIDGDSEPDITTFITGFPALGADPAHPDFSLTSWTATSRSPVQLDGVNTAGGFAIYESIGSIGFITTGVPSKLVKVTADLDSGNANPTIRCVAHAHDGRTEEATSGALKNTDRAPDTRIRVGFEATALDFSCGSSTPEGDGGHYRVNYDTEEFNPVTIGVEPSPGSVELRIYKKVDSGPYTLIFQDELGDDFTPVVTEDFSIPPGADRVCYYGQTFDENGNPSPLQLLGCLRVQGGSVPLPTPILELVKNGTNSAAPTMEITWFCPPHTVERFELWIAKEGRVAPPSNLPGSQLSNDLANPHPNFLEEFPGLDFGVYQTVVARAIPSATSGGAEFSYSVPVEKNSRYHVVVRAVGRGSHGARPVGAFSNLEQFNWLETEVNPGVDVPWPARNPAPVAEVGSFHPDLKAYQLDSIDQNWEGVGIRIGEYEYRGPNANIIKTSGVIGKTDPEAPGDLVYMLPNHRDPLQYLFKKDGQTILPCVLYRVEIASAAKPNVSGDLVQVSPMMEQIAYGESQDNGDNVIIIRDPFIAALPKQLVDNTADIATNNYDILLLDRHPVIEGATYQYLLVHFGDDKEVDFILPTNPVVIEP